MLNGKVQALIDANVLSFYVEKKGNNEYGVHPVWIA